MLVRPRLFDFNLINSLLEPPFGHDRDRKPLDAVGGFDSVAIVPMPLRVLRAVKDHIFVASADQIEETLPGNVTGLNDGNTHVKPQN